MFFIASWFSEDPLYSEERQPLSTNVGWKLKGPCSRW